jgi:asparagine synthase (glutamine-hydrolysing)
VAERYHTDHLELVVDTQVRDILPRLVWHYDEPLGDASAVPSYAIAELTRQHVTVVLNGDGGDENFAGYDWYMMDRLAHRGKVVPLALRKNFHAFMQGIPERWRQNAPLRKVARLAEVLALPPAYRYAQWVSHFGPELRDNLYASDFKLLVNESCPEALFESVFAQSQTADWTDTVLGADVQLYLPDDLLVKIDRATMAHSLEARSPLLDHELMEFVASLPAEFKLSGTRKKHILKAALRGIVPDAVLDRPKMGFSAPTARWLRHDLREMVYDILLSPRALQRGYFEPRVISTLLHQHCNENVDHAVRLWDLLTLELWHREFIDRSAFVSPQGITFVANGS